jgi:hypothetical protein
MSRRPKATSRQHYVDDENILLRAIVKESAAVFDWRPKRAAGGSNKNGSSGAV